MDIKGIESGFGINKAFSSAGSASSSSPVEGAGKFFSELVSKVNDLQTQSDQAIQGLASGENKNLHEVMISMEKASVSFLFMSQVRNKAIEAYQEVMRMQV
ncbi:flagellar hook-basal body complex protein FliE [Geobacter sp. SVR]|uniref:flagellar hook-basal body complex protein FliE n=1 Tax=Geobacter sp. SVR TaxID=2495594 RepID=UPI00143EF83E|nr:flagellar hook-basal body complex protein FliE [Geobacter sp. SVR]BCS55829.1 flagellar hook-basal body complex protein FliE [Geobacter sp. SVR]GCF83833.1 flagellar hook-basal body complex protein FliE [Geobacter sp. SVR]